MKPNPEMLTLARESRQLTLQQLADQLGVTQGYLSKLARGFIDIPDDRVAAIADALGYPVEFFYQYPAFQGPMWGLSCLTRPG